MDNLLVLFFIIIYIVLLVLCIIRLINSNINNKKEFKMILVISTIIFIIGTILYANEITSHEWVKMLNTSNLENDLQFKEYLEENKLLINLKYYGGIILIIISYIGNIIAIVKNIIYKNKEKDEIKH